MILIFWCKYTLVVRIAIVSVFFLSSYSFSSNDDTSLSNVVHKFERPSLLTKKSLMEPIKTPVKQVRALKKEKNIRLSDLPLTFKDWVLDIEKSGFNGANQCVVSNRNLTVSNTDSDIHINLRVTSESVKVFTDSPIDFAYNKNGIKIDEGQDYSLDSIFLGTNGRFDFDAAELITQMKKGHKATLTLGFWPQSLKTEIAMAEVKLGGFTSVIKAMASCNQHLAQG